MLQEMPHERYQTLLYIFNAIRRLEYWPAPLKQAKIVMIQKPGKTPTDVASYSPISFLPNLSKILEKLMLKRIYRDTNLQEWIPSHQFGFHKAHSTI
jgi:potassium voltage-gated channel Eag-related subfamily H protein 8